VRPYLQIGLLFITLAGLRADCGPITTPATYRFLNPRIVGFDSQFAPFFLHFGEVYRDYLTQPGNEQRSSNIDEWRDRFCDVAPATDIEAIIYQNNYNGLLTLRRLLEKKEATAEDLPPALVSNAFARHLLEDRCHEVVDYLLYAKRVEPYVVAGTLFSAAPASAPQEMKALLEEGLQRFPKIESHYVRLRQAYQLIRLAHYLKEYAYVLELYDYLMPKIDADPSLIYDWIEGHRAGALQSLGDLPQSAYLFSRIFERSPSKRESAYRSFRIDTDEQWRDALLLAQNDHERAMLHVLRAHNGRAVVTEELRDIYAYEPDNAALPLLTMRELQELEALLLPRKLGGREPSQAVDRRLVNLQTFVNEVVREGRTDRPDFWLLARGVLELLAGDYFFAEATFAELSAQTESDTLRRQIAILEDVTDVLQLSRITDSVELHYYDVLTDATLGGQYPDFQPLVNAKLEAVYRRTGRTAKADLIRYGFDAIRKNPSVDGLLALERMADSLNRNRFDRELLRSKIGPNAVADIHNLLGDYYLQRGQWKAALDIYRRIPARLGDGYGRFTPFERQLKDRVNYTPPTGSATYNKVQLLSRLEELEDEADRTTNDTIAARNYFNIGLALYNMSYFSYNWRFADAFRSGSSGRLAAAAGTPREVFPHVNAPLGNREHMDMDQPRYYFERALRRAPDKEAAALAAYFAAKAERNQFYADGRPGGSRPFNYFRLLRDSYADTEFYDSLIGECRTFAWFVGK
jgi:hypothetical protein